MRLAILASHPVQYQAPLFRQLSKTYDLTVFFAHKATKLDQSNAGFGVGFEWDIDLLSGYSYEFLENVSRQPDLSHFSGCDTPSIGARLEEGQYTILFVMGWQFKCFLQGVWAAKRLRLSVIVRGDSHLSTPRSVAKRIAKRVMYPIALRGFDAALYVGARSRCYWEHYGYPKERLFFSPHCVDNDWFAQSATAEVRQRLRAEHGIDQARKVILLAGKLLPLKRPLDVITAAAALASRRPNLTVLVAGSGELESTILTVARETGVHVVHLGFCNQSEMPAVYAAADALVLPSEGETWGLVANEALACGLPIIVSNACGCADDLAADGVAGRIFRMGDTDALAEAIDAVLANPPSKEAIKRKAMNYSLDKAADGIESALNSVSARRKNGR